MVNVTNVFDEISQKNVDISQIIDEMIDQYKGKGLTFYKNQYADPASPDNWIFSDKDGNDMVFNGELQRKDYEKDMAKFIVMDQKYFDWALEVSEKVEDKLSLEVELETFYN